jgi:hypothetical protein
MKTISQIIAGAQALLAISYDLTGCFEEYLSDEYKTFLVTVNSRPVRERCSKGGGQSNHPGKRHKGSAKRECEDILRG